MSLTGLGAPLDHPICSKAGCTADAKWAVRWRNPRIHSPERVKVWAACGEHRDGLADFVGRRGFPVEVTPFEESAC